MKAGTKIICPDCGAPQIESTIAIDGGSQLKDAGWKSIGYDMENSLNANCYKCGNLWYRVKPSTGENQLFTAGDGWITLAKKRIEEVQSHLH